VKSAIEKYEQLVKISTLLKRAEKQETGLTADDKKDIFDLLQGNLENAE
jgi:hypothetical protein